MPLIILGIFAFLILLFLFLIFPSPKKHKDTLLLNELYIAHRGLHSNSEGIPENSIPAFEKAIENGFAIENDIHLTKDGYVVVFHDSDAKRACGVDKKICEMTLKEIKELRLFGSEYTVPTLEECLKVIDGKVPLLIEYKYDGNSKALCEKAEAILKNYKGKYLIQSFHPQFLYWYRKHRKDICRGQLSSGFKGEALYKRLSGCLLYNFISRPHFVSYDYATRKHPCFFIATKLGAFPVGWTFRNQSGVETGKKYFKTYIFEHFTPKK